MELNGGMMSQQALDLRRVTQIVRKHRKMIGAVIVLGLLIGAACAVLKPPMMSSTALVVIPELSEPSAQSAALSNGGTTGTSDIYMATQVVIAGSDTVLADALPRVSPAMSLQVLQKNVHITSVSGSSIISITASGSTAAQAETTANAVANSYVAYTNSKTNPIGSVSANSGAGSVGNLSANSGTGSVGNLSAKSLESASVASRSNIPERIALFGLFGALAGAILGFIVSLAVGRHDRRLVERDAIANSIGAPVLVSLPVGRPADAASWAKLFDEYEPADVPKWGLTRLLRQIGITGNGAGGNGTTGNGAGGNGADGNGAGGHGSSLTVVSLASDPKALALGPQLAAFAASQGIPTALVTGPQQDANVAATLRTACAAPAGSSGRRKPLQLVVSDDGYLDQVRAAFVVVVTVVDGRAPSMPGMARTAATVLGVSAGVATADQLARAATAAAVDGREIAGILVANPEPTDKTTGRIPRLTPALLRPVPTRVTDAPTEIRR
jgi:capsular polysaccharide biosynthesis protein